MFWENIWSTSRQLLKQKLSLWKADWSLDCALNGRIIRMPPPPHFCFSDLPAYEGRLDSGLEWTTVKVLITACSAGANTQTQIIGGCLKKGCWCIIGPASIADKLDSGQESISDLSQGFVSSNGKIRCLWPMKLGMLQGCFKKGCWRIIGRVRGELNLRIDAVQESKLKSSQEQTSKAWIFPNYWNQNIQLHI